MKTGFILILLSLSFVCFSQEMEDPVKWSFESEKMADDQYKIKFIAEVESGWAIYSQYNEEGGPIPTTFQLEENSDLLLIGEVVEPDDKEKKYDDMFEMDVIKLKGNVEFYQIVKTAVSGVSLKGYVTFMCCDDTQCLPPTDVEFEIYID